MKPMTDNSKRTGVAIEAHFASDSKDARRPHHWETELVDFRLGHFFFLHFVNDAAQNVEDVAGADARSEM
jgi:hypothetical protein